MKKFTDKTKKWRTCFLLVAMIYSFASTAVADDIPASCTGTYETQAYKAGLMSGTNIVEMAWARLDNCDLVERFETIVINILQSMKLPENASTVTACRYAGFANGIIEEVDNIYRYCEGLCYYEGEIIGKLVATVYCELSISLGGLVTADEFIRSPVQICGFHFEFACDVTYLFDTMTYVNGFGSCDEYTYGEYFEVWDQVRNNQCAYNIQEDIPISNADSEGQP
jgi:hypothetical protein